MLRNFFAQVTGESVHSTNQTPQSQTNTSSLAKTKQALQALSSPECRVDAGEIISVSTIQQLLNSSNHLKLYSLFASSSVLSKSFLHPTEEHKGGIYVSEVGKTFNLIMNAKYSVDLLTLGAVMCKSLPKPSFIPSRFKVELWDILEWSDQSTISIQQIQIQLLCPLLFEQSLYGTFAIALLCAIDSSTQEVKREFVQILATYTAEFLSNIVFALQNWLTFYLTNYEKQISPTSVANSLLDPVIVAACNTMGWVFYANQQSRVVPIPYFYNSFLNQASNFENPNPESQQIQPKIHIKEHFANWIQGILKGNSVVITFCNFPFLLDPHSKGKIMQWENEVTMVQGFEQGILEQLFVGFGFPLLTLSVRRDYIVRDTIAQLLSASERDLKKILKVDFIGEEAVDAGGVQKEFFQIIIRELFNINFGMFTVDDESRTFWFNMDSLDLQEFELIGTILGLAIYNSVILELHFPGVVYKKLLSRPVELADLKQSHTAIYRSLTALSEADDEVVESFGLTFEVSHESYGSIISNELKLNGSNIPVTQHNRREFVDLYVKFLLESSIQSQWDSFQRGFHKVCGGHALKVFQPEELEQLVCGSQELDFSELEKICKYDGGYTKESPIIKDFWSFVKSLSLEDKKKFLSFSTGSDLAPIRGLGSLPQGFTISRNGPDSDRLPSAHTCFNHLLLPEYSSREKMVRFVRTAIENSQGFGLR
eukprot:c21042_g1_i1.p1 GENE.c21042_g1_i1~~c21042_g1_i1.p1  ORF type:complete len:724 (+),score=259.82 c21042_g1_i1:44-2173(+)